MSLNVFQKPAIANDAAESSKKCFHCGLMNYANQARCARCRYDVWVPLPGSENIEQASPNSRHFGRLGAKVFIIPVVLLLGLVFIYLRQDSPETTSAVSTAVMQPATQPDELPEQVIAPTALQSQEAAKHILAGLERFQLATETNMTYDAYEEALSRLKTDLNNTLPSFVDHKPGDEFFRREVEAAVRDYTAAGSWWKTAVRNSAVLTDADRNERLVTNWTSAKTHLYNAQQMFVR